MTYTLTLTPYLAAMLDAACRATGLDTLRIFPAHLTRHPEQPGATHPAAVLPTQHPAAATTATPAPEPEATTPLPTGMGLTARVAWLEGQRTTNNH